MDRYLTESEQERLLKVLKEAASRDVLGRRDYAVVRTLLYSGMRLTEFTRITLGQALEALRTGYLFIPREHRKGFSRGVAKDHQVYLTALLRQALSDLLKVRAEISREETSIHDRLVIGRHGEGVSARAVELRYKEHARMAGLARSSPHWLRHTRGQNIMRSSKSRDPRGVVQRALGHTDIRSSGVYTQLPREDVETALNEVDGRLPGRVTTAKLRAAYEDSLS